MHSACQILSRMFDLLSFTSPMSSSFIEVEVVLNIPYMVVKLSVRAIFVVKAKFFNFKIMSSGSILSRLLLLLLLRVNKSVYGLSQRGHSRLIVLLTFRKST
jgi:hypothetical protein